MESLTSKSDYASALEILVVEEIDLYLCYEWSYIYITKEYTLRNHIDAT